MSDSSSIDGALLLHQFVSWVNLWYWLLCRTSGSRRGVYRLIIVSFFLWVSSSPDLWLCFGTSWIDGASLYHQAVSWEHFLVQMDFGVLRLPRYGCSLSTTYLDWQDVKQFKIGARASDASWIVDASLHHQLVSWVNFMGLQLCRTSGSRRGVYRLMIVPLFLWVSSTPDFWLCFWHATSIDHQTVSWSKGLWGVKVLRNLRF